MSSQGKTLAHSERRAYAEKIRAALEANPKSTLNELRAASGASAEIVTQVRRRWFVGRGETQSKRVS